MPELFVHPLTGELLEADEASLHDAVNAAGREIGRLAVARDVLQGALAELRGPADDELPAKARWRSTTQEKAWRCPRCRHMVEAA